MYSQRPEINERGWHFNLPATLAATALATAALHGYLQIDHDGHGPRVYLEDLPHHIDTSRTTKQISPGHPDVRLVNRTDPVTGDPQYIAEARIAVAPYAKDFEKDAAVDIVDHGAANTISQLLDQKRQEGWQNFHLTITGHASAEDDSQAPDDGVTTPSERNKRLAGVRAQKFVTYLQDAGILGNNSTITFEVAEPQEQQLTTGSASQVATLEQVAQQNGYATIKDMIQQWNEGKTVPPTVARTLSSMLAVDRSVTVSISAVKPGVTTNVNEQVPQTICVIPVQETIANIFKTQPWKATIPWIIPIPIWLPEERRRDNKFLNKTWVTVPTRKERRRVRSGKATAAEIATVRTYDESVAADEFAYNERFGERQRRSFRLFRSTDPRGVGERWVPRLKWALPIAIAVGGLSLGVCNYWPKHTPGTTTPIVNDCPPDAPHVEEVARPAKRIRIVNGRVTQVINPPAPVTTSPAKKRTP